MKRLLLFTTSILAGTAFSQFTQSNEPVIGDVFDFYLCDSNVTNYDNITGDGVIWDYSAIMGIPSILKTVSVEDATTSANASDFPTSVKATGVQGAIITYFSSDATQRISQGFVYNEPTFGQIVAKYTTDSEKTYNYPFALGDNLTDAFSGNLAATYMGNPINPACTGDAYVWVDGRGTLQLPGNTYTNVLRYKMIDTAYANVIILGNIKVVRTQYEYYDFTTSNLPLFMHTTIAFSSNIINNLQTIVLSRDMPTNWLGLESNESDLVSIAPNPSEGTIVINGLTTTADVMVTDQNGSIVASFESVNNNEVLNLDHLSSGVYFATVKTDSFNTTERIVLK
jgi:hypothetical protein